MSSSSTDASGHIDAGFYGTVGPAAFQLFRSEGYPAWRGPQLAGLGAVVAQWSLAGAEPPLISMPTGVGKTAIALAAPYLVGARRTLVVVPSQELRRQTVAEFRSQDILRRIGALEIDDNDRRPVVAEAAGRNDDWSRFNEADGGRPVEWWALGLSLGVSCRV